MNEDKKEETLLGKELERAGFDPDGVRQFYAFGVETGAYLGMGVSIGAIVVGILMLFLEGLPGLLLGPMFIVFGSLSLVIARKMTRMVKKKGK